jgi:hypothetical protein
MKKTFTFLLISLLVISFNTFAFAEDQSSRTPSAGAVVADILVLRPIGLAGFLLGTMAFVISLPVTIPFNSSHEAAKVLVLEPCRYTFKRPFGKI